MYTKQVHTQPLKQHLVYVCTYTYHSDCTSTSLQNQSTYEPRVRRGVSAVDSISDQQRHPRASQQQLPTHSIVKELLRVTKIILLARMTTTDLGLPPPRHSREAGYMCTAFM